MTFFSSGPAGMERTAPRGGRRVAGAVWGLAGGLAAAGLGVAQQEEVRRAEVVGGSEITEASEVMAPEVTTAAKPDEVGRALAASDAAQVNLRQPKRVRLALEVGVLYDDNIFLSPRDEVSDVLYRIRPEIGLALGDALAKRESYVTINYRPEAFLFQDNTDENALDHDVGLEVQKRFAKLAVAVTGRYQRTSGSTVDLGDRVERDVYRAGTTLTYDLGAKTSLSSSLLWDATRYLEAGYADDTQWVNENFLDYNLDAKVQLGLGGGWGQLRVDGEPEHQDFQRALVRAAYHPTEKLSLRGRAGAEFRQTQAGDDVTPVFGLDADYDVTAKTSLRLRAAREVMASGSLGDLNYTRTGAGLALFQKVGDRFELGLEGGWDRYDYHSTRREQVSAERSDDSLFVRPSFTYSFAERWKAEAWYQWRSNDSGDPEQTYDVNQTGMNVRFDF